MNSVRRIRHGLIYRSVPDPIPNGQRASTFDFETLSDPMLMSKALVSAVLLTYPAIAFEYAIRYQRRKPHSSGLEITRFSTCCDSHCADHREAWATPTMLASLTTEDPSFLYGPFVFVPILFRTFALEIRVPTLTDTTNYNPQTSNPLACNSFLFPLTSHTHAFDE